MQARKRDAYTWGLTVLVFDRSTAQVGTQDCGPLAVLFLLAASVGITYEEMDAWSIDDITRAGRALRVRMARDLYNVAPTEVRRRMRRDNARPASPLTRFGPHSVAQVEHPVLIKAWQTDSLVREILERIESKEMQL